MGIGLALQAVAAEKFDVCLCMGDLVDYGLEPSPCIAWVREHCAHFVRGNHDHGVAQNVLATGRTGFKYLTGVTRAITRERLSETDLRALSQMPVSKKTGDTLDNTRYLLVHVFADARPARRIRRPRRTSISGHGLPRKMSTRMSFASATLISRMSWKSGTNSSSIRAASASRATVIRERRSR